MVYKFLIRGLAVLALVSCSTQRPVQQTDDTAPSRTSTPDTSSVEWIEVYFNMPGDKQVSLPGNEANDEADLLKTLIEKINAAKYSIDLSIYNLENHEVGEALVRAANRGVRVRITTDHYNRYRDRELGEKMWTMLREAGIYSIDDAGEVYRPDGSVDADRRLPGASYDMHNKFAVFDMLSENPDDYYVWTGSMNLTYTGPFNSNNTIVIKDSGIAEAYYREFNQMWGGDGDVPVPRRARFHKDKRYVGENTFYVDTTKVELYFAPMDRNESKPSVAERLHELVRDYVQEDINFLAFAITHDMPMSQTMWERSFTDGIKLQGVIDPRFYVQYRNTGTIWASPESQLGNRTILPANELRTLHHKILLVDVANSERKRGIAVAGSYNFSRNAEENNDENTLIFHSPEIANQYYQDFMGVLNRAKGLSEPPIPDIVHEEWYNVMDISDGNRFEIEIAPRFGYPVRFLGLQTPRIYAGEDSSEYYSLEAAMFLEELIAGKDIRMYGYDLFTPENRYGSWRAYVQVKNEDGSITDVNRELLLNGYAEWSKYYRQHPDSISAYQEYERIARENKRGIWKNPGRIGEMVERIELGEEDLVPVTFPVNINTADEHTLQALTGIGATYAARIIEYRIRNGGFREVEELRNIEGIGPVTFEKIRPFVTTE
jgi:competence ComEA-like helix-hairpin-helix protein